MEDIKTRLTQDLADVDWNDIKPHAQRDAVIVVNEKLDILEVGVAIAKDDTVAVQHWITEQLIKKPSNQQLSNWNVNPSQIFKTLIVQPFVLVQEY